MGWAVEHFCSCIQICRFPKLPYNHSRIQNTVRFVNKLTEKIAMYKHHAYLECQVSRANAKVTWYKNKSEIKPSKKHEITSEDIYRKLTVIIISMKLH